MANTALSTLYANALSMADHPSADTTAVTKMKLFINQTLQELYSGPGRRCLEDNGSVATVANQEYVELSNITLVRNTGTSYSVDEISRVYQTTDDITLERWSMQKYRTMAPDVSSYTGNPIAYARWRDRLYLYPRPTSAITLYLDVWVSAIPLTLDADMSLILPKYDEAILSGAVYRWYTFIEPGESTKISVMKGKYDELKAIFERDMEKQPDNIPVVGCHGEYGSYGDFWRAITKRPWGTT